MLVYEKRLLAKQACSCAQRSSVTAVAAKERGEMDEVFGMLFSARYLVLLAITSACGSSSCRSFYSFSVRLDVRNAAHGKCLSRLT